MKLNLAATALLLPLVSGYTTGGYDRFGRPIIIRSTTGSSSCGSGCAPTISKQQQAFRRQQELVDRAFEDLASDGMGSRRRRRRELSRQERIKANEDAIRKQQEFFNNAFDLATEVASGIAASSREGKANNNDAAISKQKEWANRAFNIASGVVASGVSSPRYDIIQNDDEVFQVSLDVPGVKPSAMDVSVKEKDDGTKGYVLTIQGEREVIGGSRKKQQADDDNDNDTDDTTTRDAIKFSKSFLLDDTADTESITAELNNGVLMVSVSKEPKTIEENIKKIPVTEVNNEATISVGGNVEEEEKSNVEKDEEDSTTKTSNNLESTGTDDGNSDEREDEIDLDKA